MRLPLLMAIFLFAEIVPARAQAEFFRTWTDTRKQTLEAAMTRVEAGKVILKQRDGREIAVPLAEISEADRKWVAEQTSTAPAAAATPKAAADWPRTVALPAAPAVEVVREDAGKKEYIYETEHYQFLTDAPLGANLVREFSRIFEATWLVNCLLPLDFKPRPEAGREKFRARIFSSDADYYADGGPAKSAGAYFPLEGVLKLPLSSLGVKMFGSRVTIDYASEDYHTLIHEITHQMMSRWIPKLPIWYFEGAAEYVAITKYENGRFSFLQQDNRLRDWLMRSAGGGKFRMVSLGTLMAMTPAQWNGALEAGRNSYLNYASGAALTYYFYHLDGDGKGTQFQSYIREAEKLRRSDDEAALVEKYLLRGRDHAALERDVQRGMRRIGVAVEFAD